MFGRTQFGGGRLDRSGDRFVGGGGLGDVRDGEQSTGQGQARRDGRPAPCDAERLDEVDGQRAHPVPAPDEVDVAEHGGGGATRLERDGRGLGGRTAPPRQALAQHHDLAPPPGRERERLDDRPAGDAAAGAEAPGHVEVGPADLARRYDALLVPICGIRQPDGLSFKVNVGAPIAHGDSRAMMQALNDDLEMLVRRHMDQWFWVHRRWK